MRKLSRLLLVLAAAATYVCAATAQEVASKAPIHKVLQITREFIKPGKAGLAHDKTESAYVGVLSRAKWPTHYLAMCSLSGKPRCLYLTWYDSFEAWQKDMEATMKNSTLFAALDRASMADGELLDATDQGVFYFHDEMSLHPRADLSHMRYMEVSLFHVRPGKDKQWEEVVKMAQAGYEKSVPDAHWGMFEEIYGADGGTYLLLSSHQSLAELDKAFAEGKQFEAAMGEEGMKKFNELYADCCEPAQSQVFAFNPQQSYVQDDWIKSDPGFWKVRPAASSAAKPTAEEKKKKP